MRILYAEDDKILGKATQSGLRLKYAVDWVLNGVDALHSAQTHPYDLVILDINLPDMSGLEVLKKIRQQKIQVPILLLTARAEVSSRIEGLNAGADDYLPKPFDLDELLARAAALIRRAAGHVAPVITWRDTELSPSAKTFRKQGKNIALSAREFAIAEMLMMNAGKIIPRAQIEESIYGWNEISEIESNTVEVHISSLRRKIGKDFIETIRGLGYRIGA